MEKQEALKKAKETGETVESKRAAEINELLGPKFDLFHDNAEEMRTDIVVDLHSTTSNMGITLIVAEGDVLMTQAAAYVAKNCNHVKVIAEGDASHDPDTIFDVHILMHTHPNREVRPNLSSTGRHGFTIEVGPVPQGIVRHDAVIKLVERRIVSALGYGVQALFHRGAIGDGPLGETL